MGNRAQGENKRRMRFYRRNFKRMYPQAGAEAAAKVDEEVQRRRVQFERDARRRRLVQWSVAAAAVAGAVGWWWWLLR